jgi:branched-chain amino acid transport system substrate-binding protein
VWVKRILSATLASCAIVASVPGTAGAAGAPSGPPVEVPAILPLTGPAAFYGASLQQGLQAFQKYVNAQGGIQGRPLAFTVSDDQANPQLAIQLLNAAIAKHAPVVLGGGFSASCKAMAPLVEKNGPVLYCFSPAVRPAHESYVFSGNIHPADLYAASLRFFKSRGWNRIALLVATDASGQEVDANLNSLLSRPALHGLQIVAHEHFSPSDAVLNAQVAKIEAAKPDAMIIWAATGIEKAFRALKEAGSKIPVATSNSIMLYSAMKEYGNILPDQLYFAIGKWAAYDALGNGPVKDATKAYYTAFQSQGIQPDQGQDVAWDPALIVVDALRHLGPNASAKQVHDYIEQLHGLAGTNGYYDFRTGDQRGLNPNDTIVVEWNRAKKTWTSPATVAGR